MNIALANLLSLSMPVHLNLITWIHFLKLFAQVARSRTVESLDEFKAAARMVHTYLESVDPDIATFIGCATTLRADEFLPVIGETELDPIVPAFYVLADHWGKKTGEWFEIRSDESETLALERERLMALANPAIEPVTQGYVRRKMEFPLKVIGIVPVDSKSEVQVQLADVIAGAVAAAMKAKLQKPSGDFESKCFDASLDREIFVDEIWPSKDIDPKDLGTDIAPQPGEEDLAAFTARIFNESPEIG
jgi:hypothetical protein